MVCDRRWSGVGWPPHRTPSPSALVQVPVEKVVEVPVFQEKVVEIEKIVEVPVRIERTVEVPVTELVEVEKIVYVSAPPVQSATESLDGRVSPFDWSCAFMDCHEQVRPCPGARGTRVSGASGHWAAASLALMSGTRHVSNVFRGVGGGTGHLGCTETQRGRLWTACGQRCVDSKNSQTTPATTSTSSIRQLLGAADTQTAHPATFSTAPTHQPLGSANAETTPARAPAAAADRKQRPDATCEGKNG